jgi:hypothetical protein
MKTKEDKTMTKGARARTAYSLARFGHTYTFIADLMGISRQRVHQMVKSQSIKFGQLAKRKVGRK